MLHIPNGVKHSEIKLPCITKRGEGHAQYTIPKRLCKNSFLRSSRYPKYFKRFLNIIFPLLLPIISKTKHWYLLTKLIKYNRYKNIAKIIFDSNNLGYYSDERERHSFSHESTGNYLLQGSHQKTQHWRYSFRKCEFFFADQCWK